jgi:hypothetical protein
MLLYAQKFFKPLNHTIGGGSTKTVATPAGKQLYQVSVTKLETKSLEQCKAFFNGLPKDAQVTAVMDLTVHFEPPKRWFNLNFYESAMLAVVVAILAVLTWKMSGDMVNI